MNNNKILISVLLLFLVSTGGVLFFRSGSKQLSHQIIHSEAAIAGNVIIRNCMMLNGPYFAIQINTRCGEIEICNNVIII